MRRGLLLLLAATALNACGDSDGGGTADEPERDTGGRSEVVGRNNLEHIHGLGVNPRDRALMIATHRGLFRSGPNDEQATRVGDRQQDTMGFTVVGPDRFLGSGHPDLRDDLPPMLGLIRSRDGGNTWQPVSLLGKADFHTLRADGRFVYGVDRGRLLISADEGRSWSERGTPGPLFDLAIQPGNPRRLVGAGASGLIASRDQGRSWRALRAEPGLLAWSKELFHVDASGKVHRSTDAGASWTAMGSIGSAPAALLADADRLYAALHDGSVLASGDGGRSWRVRVASESG